MVMTSGTAVPLRTLQQLGTRQLQRIQAAVTGIINAQILLNAFQISGSAMVATPIVHMEMMSTIAIRPPLKDMKPPLINPNVAKATITVSEIPAKFRTTISVTIIPIVHMVKMKLNVRTINAVMVTTDAAILPRVFRFDGSAMVTWIVLVVMTSIVIVILAASGHVVQVLINAIIPIINA